VGNLIGSMYMYKFSCACTYQASWARWVSFRVNLSRCHVRCTCLEGGWRELWGEKGWRRGVGWGIIWGMVHGCGIS
jgi:hypothetical protein